MSVKSSFSNNIEKVLNEYGIVLATFVIGLIIGWQIKFWFADRRYIKQIDLRLKEKDEQINSLKAIVLERLTKIKVEEKDKTFFNKIKGYFKNPTKKS